MTLRMVGNYRELPHGEQDGPSISERKQYDAPVKLHLLTYLTSGPVLAASGSVVVDYFDGSQIGPLNLQTDGRWVWYSDLAHYLDKWDVELESAFIDHVLSARLADLGAVDLDAAERLFFQ